DDKECIELIKKLLSFMPQNWKEKPPRIDTGDDPNRMDEALDELIPDDPKKAYDMKEVIKRTVDNGEFLEIKPNYAMNMIVGFARYDGYPVGIVANQPRILAGTIDIDASDKAARFIRFCDCFNIPIITFVDAPGYLPGIEQEHGGIIRHGAKMLYAYSEATVPLVTCIVRKDYGGAVAAMGYKLLGADILLAWPTAEIAIMGAEAAVNVLYAKELKKVEDPEKFREEKIKEFREKFSNPYYQASKLIVDAVIRPSETRPWIINCLDMLKDKEKKPPEKKHGNIPL
ncbi:MAG: acyl-CoA carboxylase subunit beta, partial [Candidatus Syntropharchaeia archaeon]